MAHAVERWQPGILRHVYKKLDFDVKSMWLDVRLNALRLQLDIDRYPGLALIRLDLNVKGASRNGNLNKLRFVFSSVSILSRYRAFPLDPFVSNQSPVCGLNAAVTIARTSRPLRSQHVNLTFERSS